MPPSTGTSCSSVCSSVWRAARSRWNALCGALVSAAPPGAWRWASTAPAIRARGQQVRRAGAAGGFWLDRRAQVYAAIIAGYPGAVLAVFSQRSQTPGAKRQVHRPAQGTEGPKVRKLLPVLQHRVRRLRGAVAVDGAVLHWVNTAWTSASRRCWRPASRCPAACCAPSAACCPTSMAPTA